ncbi:MAG: peptidase U32 family protein, partial [Turicibacter sp.]
MSKIELLAPVGHKEGLLAAVTNGADAIYVGGAAFGARKEAAFSHEELIEVIKYSHLHHVKVYVTVNTTIFEAELEPLKEYIHFLYTHDADAIIVQDIGVANLVRRLYPDFELHFSTQMTLHNSEGVKFAKDFGADRVVVARENSLDEIKAMKEQVDIDLEVFVHGAICVCYSGQCLMSSMIGARSGNRGMCAQTCRLPYELVDLKTGKTLHSEVGDFLLSPRDLSSIEEVGQLIDAGVTSFKIEGRLKRPEYVATVVKAYREAIDQYMETKRVKLTKQTHEDLNQIFSRGFTKGFLFGETGMNFMSTDRPNHKGILIGEVTAVRGKRVSVNLTSPLHVQDGLRFVSSNIKDKDQGLQVQKMFVKNDDVKIANKGLVEFDVPFTATKGMKVYKTLSVELNKRVEVNEKNTATTPIYGEVTAKLGEPLRMMIWDDHSNVVEVFSECVLETAQKTPLSKDRLSDQLQKTGGTPFKFSYLTVNLEDGITMPISVINAFRREAL